MNQIKKIRKFVLGVSVFLLFLMVIFYLFSQMEISNLVGSIGFGMFVIIIFSYLPELTKKGYIEKY